jgi:hypothetical protein
MHEITHLVKALDHVCAEAMVELDNAAMTELARQLRDTSAAEWFALREGFAPEIPELIALPRSEWSRRWPDRRARTALALAAWQTAQDLSLLLGALRDADSTVTRFDPAWMRQLASEAVAELQQSRAAASLWPGELGSPFVR